jgi:hypothetical protein
MRAFSGSCPNNFRFNSRSSLPFPISILAASKAGAVELMQRELDVKPGMVSRSYEHLTVRFRVNFLSFGNSPFPMIALQNCQHRSNPLTKTQLLDSIKNVRRPEKAVATKHLNLIHTVSMLICSLHFLSSAAGQITVELQSTSTNGGNVYSMAVSGHYVYVANDFDGIRIYDVSNPKQPVNVGHAVETNGGGACRIAVSGQYAYVANFSDGLRIYDVSNPTNPVSIGQTNNAGTAFNVTVSGHYAFLADQSDGLRIYDITDPTNPSNIGHAAEPGFGSAQAVAVVGHYAYVANYSDGLRIYDVSDPTNPISVGQIVSSGLDAEAVDVAVSGHYAYVANFKDGLRIYDISDPTNPTEAAQVPAQDLSTVFAVTISGDYLYLANTSQGVQIFDISDPLNPQMVVWEDVGQTVGVAVSGPYLYAACWDQGLLNFAVVPRLRINPAGSNEVQLSWPATAPFAVQMKSDLSNSNWTTLTNVPIQTGATDQLLLNAQSGHATYRLISK